MAYKIKIIGAGLSGLLTAYFLLKLIAKNNQEIEIEIFDEKNIPEENASTISVGWLNATYPCSDKEDEKIRYDQFRIDSINAWASLNTEFIKDGIHSVIASYDHILEIDQHLINSIYIFFNSTQQDDFLGMIERLKTHLESYQAHLISKEKLIEHFPFLNFPAQDLHICNIANELLVNPYQLRAQLITYLQKNHVTFHWGVQVANENIQAEPETNWILAAGNGSLSLIKSTKLEKANFIKESIAEVIYTILSQPVDLKGKILHFSPSPTTPGFHLRNNDTNLNELKIVIDYDTRTPGTTLNEMAEAIFKLLNLPVASYECLNTIKRPMTPDGRPLVETNLGPNGNIHFIYGHNLYSNAATLFRVFASNIAFLINQKIKNRVFDVDAYNKELDLFLLSDRFPQQKFYSYLKMLMFAKHHIPHHINPIKNEEGQVNPHWVRYAAKL